MVAQVCIRKDKLSKQETDFYSSIYMQCQGWACMSGCEDPSMGPA